MATQMAALRNLTHHRMGFRVAVAAATIGVIYAYDLGNISGALLFITEEFDLSTKQTEWVATIVVAGSIAGALVAGRLANAIGRKPTMILVAITYAVFAILSGLAQSLVSLDVARFFLGVIIGPYVLSALESLGGTATFAMFAALAVVSFASVWWLAPETKGRPLEAIRAYWENGGRWPEPATAAAGRDARFTREGAPAPAGDSPTGTRRG